MTNSPTDKNTVHILPSLPTSKADFTKRRAELQDRGQDSFMTYTISLLTTCLPEDPFTSAGNLRIMTGAGTSRANWTSSWSDHRPPRACRMTYGDTVHHVARAPGITGDGAVSQRPAGKWMEVFAGQGLWRKMTQSMSLSWMGA